MQSIRTLAIGKCAEAERWIEVRVDEQGGCALVLSTTGNGQGPSNVFPCSLANLRLVSQGMSYQANTEEGYVTLSAYQGCVHVYARHNNDRRTWTCTMPLAEFANGIKNMDETLLGNRFGYAA